MPVAHAVNIALSLDGIHEGNGPLVVLPGSHRLGLLDLPEKGQEGDSDWQQRVAADLACTVSEERAEKPAAEYGRVLITGKAGTVHSFHSSIVHSSSGNISPDRRALLLITYNSVDNAPENPTRPESLVTRDSTRHACGRRPARPRTAAAYVGRRTAEDGREHHTPEDWPDRGEAGRQSTSAVGDGVRRRVLPAMRRPSGEGDHRPRARQPPRPPVEGRQRQVSAREPTAGAGWPPEGSRQDRQVAGVGEQIDVFDAPPAACPDIPPEPAPLPVGTL